MLTHDQPALLVAHPASFFCTLPFFLFFCLLIFFSSTSLILTLCCGFTVFKSTLHYRVAENWRCSGAGGDFLLPSLHCILPCIRQGSRGPCSGTWVFVDLRHWQLIPPDNTQITFAISEVTKWNVFLQSMLIHVDKKKISVSPSQKKNQKKCV